MTLYWQSIPGNRIDNTLMKKIVNMTQAHLPIPTATIEHSFSKRDTVFCYYDSKHHKLVATVGFQYCFTQDAVILYSGNATVDRRYQRLGICSHAQANMLKKTFRKYPRLKKYGAALVATPAAFCLLSKLPVIWPNPRKKMPRHVWDKMFTVADTIAGNEHFYCREDAIITNQLPLYDKLTTPSSHILSSRKQKKRALFFKQKNPLYETGHQLLMVYPFNTTNTLTILFHSTRYFKHQLLGHSL